jgi:hypothetical protein
MPMKSCVGSATGLRHVAAAAAATGCGRRGPLLCESGRVLIFSLGTRWEWKPAVLANVKVLLSWRREVVARQAPFVLSWDGPAWT